MTEATPRPNDERSPAAAPRSRGKRGHGTAAAPPPPAEDRLAARVAQLGGVALARMYHRVLVRAPLRLPREGPAILVCNHISGLDPVLIQSVFPRMIVWMMAREYYDIRQMKWFFDLIGNIPVDRSGRDLAATRAALRALDDGRILGIFPEGRIAPTRELLPFQTGVAMIAIKMKVPVYPAYLDGTQRGMPMLRAFLTPNEATLTGGPPVEFDRSSTSRDALEAATDRIQGAVETLRMKAWRNRWAV